MSATDPPVFSVVVPTHDRAGRLEACLRAWELQEPGDLPFEVVVVDDGSADRTPKLLAAIRPERYRLRTTRQENAGPARARNRALGLATGRWILFTGDDIEPSPELLARHLDGHRDHPGEATAIVGRIRWAEEPTPTRTMLHVDGPGAQQFGFHWMEHDEEYDFRHFYTSNVSVGRSLLDREPGPFSTDFPAAAWEDAELGYRLRRHGLRIVYRADALARHHHVYGVESFARRQRTCGRMAVVLAERQPQLAAWARIDDLQRAIRHVAEADREELGRLDRLADDLETASRRVLSVAAVHDPIPERGAEPFDGFLIRLFEHAFLDGVAREWFPDSRRLRALLFDGSLLPATISFLDRLEAAGLPFGPAADCYALRSLAPAVPR